MTDGRVGQIRARLNAHSASLPWEMFGSIGRGFGVEDRSGKDVAVNLARPVAELIANAPADLAWLLNEHDRLQEAITEAITYAREYGDGFINIAELEALRREKP